MNEFIQRVNQARSSETFSDTIKAIWYLCFYMHKMYEEVDKMQNADNYKWNDMYFIDEKLVSAFEQIDSIGFENVKRDIKWLMFEDLKDAYYMNIS